MSKFQIIKIIIFNENYSASPLPRHQTNGLDWCGSAALFFADTFAWVRVFNHCYNSRAILDGTKLFGAGQFQMIFVASDTEPATSEDLFHLGVQLLCGFIGVSKLIKYFVGDCKYFISLGIWELPTVPWSKEIASELNPNCWFDLTHFHPGHFPLVQSHMSIKENMIETPVETSFALLQQHLDSDYTVIQLVRMYTEVRLLHVMNWVCRTSWNSLMIESSWFPTREAEIIRFPIVVPITEWKETLRLITGNLPVRHNYVFWAHPWNIWHNFHRKSSLRSTEMFFSSFFFWCRCRNFQTESETFSENFDLNSYCDTDLLGSVNSPLKLEPTGTYPTVGAKLLVWSWLISPFKQEAVK